jgi:hypothetical protein
MSEKEFLVEWERHLNGGTEGYHFRKQKNPVVLLFVDVLSIFLMFFLIFKTYSTLG